MENELKKTLMGLLFLAALSLVIGLVLFRSVFPSHYFGLFPLLVVVFLLVNGVFFYMFFRSMKKTDAQFIRFFMAASGIKIMVYLVIILTYVLIVPQHAISFTVSLLLLYVVFTTYDLLVMLRVQKRKREKKPGTDQQTN